MLRYPFFDPLTTVNIRAFLGGRLLRDSGSHVLGVDDVLLVRLLPMYSIIGGGAANLVPPVQQNSIRLYMPVTMLPSTCDL